MYRGASKLTHLLFEDDSLLLLHATTSEVATVTTILQRYEALSGQKINLHKSEIVFAHVQSGLVHLVSPMLGVRVVVHHDLYLGLSTSIDRLKWDVF